MEHFCSANLQLVGIRKTQYRISQHAHAKTFHTFA